MGSLAANPKSVITSTRKLTLSVICDIVLHQHSKSSLLRLHFYTDFQKELREGGQKKKQDSVLLTKKQNHSGGFLAILASTPIVTYKKKS